MIATHGRVPRVYYCSITCDKDDARRPLPASKRRNNPERCYASYIMAYVHWQEWSDNLVFSTTTSTTTTNNNNLMIIVMMIIIIIIIIIIMIIIIMIMIIITHHFIFILCNILSVKCLEACKGKRVLGTVTSLKRLVFS